MPLKKPKMTLEQAKAASFSIESPRRRVGAATPASSPDTKTERQSVAAEPIRAPDRAEPTQPHPATVQENAIDAPHGGDQPAADAAAAHPTPRPMASDAAPSLSDRPEQRDRSAATKSHQTSKPRTPPRPDRPKTKPEPSKSVQTIEASSADETKPAAMFVGKASAGAGAIIPVSAPIPSPGVSATFDALAQTRSPAEAIQALLRKALNAYEPMLIDGSFAKAPTTYPTDEPDVRKGEVWIRRKLSQPALDAARAHFDPYEVDPARPFGRKVAVAALAAYFDNENKG